MLRLINSELKKIILKPTAFIMVAILAAILVFSFNFYEPKGRTDNRQYITGKSITVSSIYSTFKSTSGSVNQTIGDNTIQDALNTIEFYEKTDNDLQKDLATKFKLLTTEYSQFSSNIGLYYSTSSKFDKDTYIAAIDKSEEQCRIYADSLKSSFFDDVDSKRILIYHDDYNALSQAITSMSKFLTLDASANRKNIEVYNTIVTNFKNNNLINISENYIPKIKNIDFGGTELLTKLKTDYYDEASKRLKSIYEEITKFKDDNSKTVEDNQSTNNINKINDLVSAYLNTASQCKLIVNDKLLITLADKYKESDFIKFKNYEDFTSYQTKQDLSKTDYLFLKGYFDYNYAEQLSFVKSSNFEKNAYDFMYFILELFSYVIIVFCVVIVSNSIAGEQGTGTLKLLAIRPYSRSKILSAKILATAFFMFVFVIFTALISFIIGSTMFGTQSQTILGVLNGTKVFTISAPMMMIIYILTLFLKIFVYIALAFAVSVIFRSYAASIAVSMGTFFISVILGVFLSNQTLYKFFPLNNIDMFKYLGGGTFPSAITNNGILSLFTSPILMDTGIEFSFLNISITLLILIISSFIVFKHRDIA
jgi:ABC-type transport system involved in multi-copper enzyme maturation permease subunit